MVTKKLKDITFDEAVAMCQKRTECSDNGGCPFKCTIDTTCLLQQVHRIKTTTPRGEYYNEHKNDLVTFEYDDGNTNTNDGGITW